MFFPCRLIWPYELHLRGLRRAKTRTVSGRSLPPPPPAVKEEASNTQAVLNGQVRNKADRKVGLLLAGGLIAWWSCADDVVGDRVMMWWR